MIAECNIHAVLSSFLFLSRVEGEIVPGRLPVRFPAKDAYYHLHKLDAFLGVFCKDPIAKLKKEKEMHIFPIHCLCFFI